MKQVIPYVKEIVFKTKIASITSISLEHEEKVYDSEVAGDFIVFGDYKLHNDTTEKELFKYRLPFTAILPDNALKDSIKIDVEDFTYDQVEDDVIKVNIDFSISYDEDETIEERKEIPNEEQEKMDNDVIDVTEQVEEIDQKTIKEIEEFLKNKEKLDEPEIRKEEEKEIVVVREEKDENMDKVEEENKRDIVEVTNEEKIEKEEIKETKEEYVKYHIHIVKENETIEQIINLYESNMETIKLYNEIDKIKTGDKLIIPEYIDE